jgi:hypothetical protein
MESAMATGYERPSSNPGLLPWLLIALALVVAAVIFVQAL